VTFSFLVQNARRAVSLIGGPAGRSALALAAADSTEHPVPCSEDQIVQRLPEATDQAESMGAERS
jgi:hypothetical protein